MKFEKIAYSFEMPKPVKKSAADKLYDIITASADLGNDRIRKIWNLESRLSAVHHMLRYIGSIYDTNPTHSTDLETLAKCAETLEKKMGTSHWQKAYSNEKRRITRGDAENTLATLKSYIGTEALKKGRKFNKETNKIEEIEEETVEPKPKKRLIDRIAYI